MGIGAVLLSVGSTLLTPPGLAATEGRVPRIAEVTGRSPAVVQPAGGGAQESVGTTFAYLAARASGAPGAQLTPTPGPDGSVRVILAPDARGPLPPAVMLPAGQLAASPVPLASTTSNGVPAAAGVNTTSSSGVPAAAGPNTTSSGVPIANPNTATRGVGPAASTMPLPATGAPGTATGPTPLLGGTTLAATSASTSGGASSSSGRIIPNLPATPNGARLVGIAQTQIGARYTWAGVSPATGFDCSGFVYYVYNSFGYSLPRTMEDQLASGRRVRLEELRPGDIVFFADTYTSGLSHNGIYIGDGKFIHAVDESTGVAITPMNAAYWEQRYVTAVRVVE